MSGNSRLRKPGIVIVAGVAVVVGRCSYRHRSPNQYPTSRMCDEMDSFQPALCHDSFPRVCRCRAIFVALDGMAHSFPS